jgi:hypothetical protein
MNTFVSVTHIGAEEKYLIVSFAALDDNYPSGTESSGGFSIPSAALVFQIRIDQPESVT